MFCYIFPLMVYFALKSQFIFSHMPFITISKYSCISQSIITYSIFFAFFFCFVLYRVWFSQFMYSYSVSESQSTFFTVNANWWIVKLNWVINTFQQIYQKNLCYSKRTLALYVCMHFYFFLSKYVCMHAWKLYYTNFVPTYITHINLWS